MSSPGPELQAARRKLARIRALLMDPGPENLVHCRSLLEGVITSLDEFARRWREADCRGSEVLRLEILSVRREAGWALALFEQVGAYYKTVESLLSLAAVPDTAGGYEAGGGAVPPARGSCPHVVLHG